MAPPFMPRIDTGIQPPQSVLEGILEKGYFEQMVFPGINLIVVDLTAEYGFTVDFEKNDHVVEFGFILNGKARAFHKSGAFDPIEISRKSSIIHYLPQMPVTFEACADSCIRMLGIEVNSQILRQLLHEEGRTCTRLEKVLKDNSAEHFLHSGDMAAMQSTIVNQMFSCPYRGQISRLFMQSKVLELISIQLHMLTRSGLPAPPEFVSAGDEERIRYARKLLKNRMTEAPTLTELSALVGLSPSKLKKGFKIVYGKTAYACLHDDRMETAHTLLSERRMNVSEVAWHIGYINVGHFSTAFRKHFGIRPKEFQLRYA